MKYDNISAEGAAMKRHRLVKKRSLPKKAAIFLIPVLTAIIVIDIRLTPIVNNVSEYYAKTRTTNLINQSVAQTISDYQISYDDIIIVSNDADGNVTSLQTNAANVNLIKTEVIANINKAISDDERGTVSIPVGTLLNNEILRGRGPEIDIKIQLASAINTDISSEFISAGINQTCHKIVLNLTAAISVISVGRRICTTVETNFCIAETVIVGTVPGAYTEVIEGDSGVGDTIANYGASVE
jgi:sporulation protein YunB